MGEAERERELEGLEPVAVTAAAAVLGMLITGAVLATPYVSFGYRSPSLHLALDSVDSCVALLLAYLLQGRYKRIGRLQDALVADGLLLLGLAGLGLTLLLSQLNGVVPQPVGIWLPLGLRVVGAFLIAAGALAGARPMPAQWRSPSRLLPWLVLAGGSLLLWLTRGSLPVALQEEPVAGGTPVLTGHPGLLGAHAASGLAFLLAAVVFTSQAVRRQHDPLLLWLGPAFMLAAFARLNYVLFPSLYSGWLFTGDVLRTASYAVLLLGAAREIGRYWSAQARAAVLDDRRRLARELHDGVVQELAFIRGEAVRLGDAADGIVESCDRGLDEARAAIDALGSRSDEPLGYVLHRAARQVAERYGGSVVVEVDDSVEADQQQRHALVRITREAVSNAIRHGRAACTRIRLESDHGRRCLVVSDDGAGFDVDRTRSGGYGLTSMSERASALPGSFQVKSEPGKGTNVVVTW